MFWEEIVKVFLDLGGVRGREEGVVVGVVVPYWNGRRSRSGRRGRLLLVMLLMPENGFGSSENYRRRIVLSARDEIVV